MRSMTLALVATALLAAPGALFASGGQGGDWEIGVYGGYAWLDDYGFLHPKDSPLFGARLGYFLTPHWGLEASAQRIFSETDLGLLGVQDADVNLDAARLNLLYNFAPCKAFRPFLTAGAGYERADADNLGESCDFGWNVGGGLRLFLSPQWNLRADGRYVRTSVGDDINESQGNIEATLGLGFLFGGGKCGEEEAEEIQTTPNQAPSVTCAAERSEILPGETVTLSATATDPESDPITYEWSATTGRVSGSGNTASFEFTGATPPSSATVTVRASDNHGNTGTCDVTVQLGQAAPPKAEAVSCIAGGFPRNLSRLNNVDKACLDNVTQRLNSDPRAQVIVIGHADSHESSAEEVAEQRAEAVKSYLVQERGIEASRITTRSSPPDTGADAAGQAGNRRVEVWFVPEGATAPK